jgi:ABC-type phosphate transport system permease subunit
VVIPGTFVTEVLVGVPSIVTGAFVYALWVIHFGYSGLAASIALATIMLPPIIRLVARHGRSAAWPQLTTLTWTAAKWIGR